MGEGKVVVDADFLSSFIKIGRVSLIFKVLKVDEIIIPTAVLDEIKQSHFYDKFLKLLSSKENKITVKDVGKVDYSNEYGKGELECISLAKKNNSLLLMDDRSAGRLAEGKEIFVFDIATFLIYSKIKDIIPYEEIKQIIKELKEKDYYEFAKEVENNLLDENAT